MIDYASYQIKNFSNNEFEKLVERMGVICPINSNKLNFDFHNLKINYYPNDNSIRISNSMHKFYNSALGTLKSAQNYNDFMLKDMRAVADIISIIYFDRPTTDFMLSRKLEVGINVNALGYKPFDIIDRYLSYQVGSSNNPVVTCEPLGKGKPVLRKCYLSDYKLKFYDKSKQANLSIKSILRYEVVFEQLRKIRAVLGEQNLTMETLCEDKNWYRFGCYLLDAYRNVKKLPLIDGETIIVEDLNKIHAHCNYHFKADLKRALRPNTYEKTRVINKNCYSCWDNNPNNIHLAIENKIINKINQLANVPVSVLVRNYETALN